MLLLNLEHVLIYWSLATMQPQKLLIDVLQTLNESDFQFAFHKHRSILKTGCTVSAFNICFQFLTKEPNRTSFFYQETINIVLVIHIYNVTFRVTLKVYCGSRQFTFRSPFANRDNVLYWLISRLLIKLMIGIDLPVGVNQQSVSYFLDGSGMKKIRYRLQFINIISVASAWWLIMRSTWFYLRLSLANEQYILDDSY